MTNNQETSAMNNEERTEAAGTGAVKDGKETAKTVRKVVTAGSGAQAVKPKKKKIIIVTAGNAGGGGRTQTAAPQKRQPTGAQNVRPQSGSSRSNGNNTFVAHAPVHKIIKPKTAPTQVEVSVRPSTEPKTAAKEEETVKQVVTAAPTETKAAEPAKMAAVPETPVAAAVPVPAETKAAEPVKSVSAPEKTAENRPAEPVKTKTVKTESPKEMTASEKTSLQPSENAPVENAPVEKAPAEKAPAENRKAQPASAPVSAADTSAQQKTAVRNPQTIPYIRDPAERLHRSGNGQSNGRSNAAGGNRQNGSQNGNRQGGSAYGNRQGGQGSYGQNRSGSGTGSYGQNRSYGAQGGSSYQGRTARPGQGAGGQGGYNQNRGGQTGGSSYGNRQGGQGGYNQNRGGAAAQGGTRPAFGGAGNRRQATRPAPAGDTFVKDAEKHRDADRRKAGQERDKRNRKDYMYNEEESQQKRAGRFIKPEKVEEKAPEEQIKTISVPDKITIRDLAEKMHLRDADIIKKLFLAGKVTTPNTELTYEEVENIAVDYDILCEKEEKVDVIQEMLKDEEDAEETLVDRAPVVCVMGHVDHGKTTLLDYIKAWSLGITDEDKKERERKMAALSVANKEAGGITQAIGAYQVDVKGRKITFLDTPGHEAFTAMRMRGAKSTDIAILVVAADDGVMPQTIEAINHAKAAGIEIIVAVNKIDKPGANIDMVKQELTKYELVATDWGGNTEFVPVSAKAGTGVVDLLDTVLLTADIMELKSNPNRRARGLVLEARLDKGRGPVANVLVQKGTLHVGDFISAGAASGKVRAMIDDRGRNVKTAGPSMPVEVLGLSEAPSAGEVILAHEDDKTAKQFAATYRDQHKEDLLEETKMHMSLDDLFTQMKEGNLKEFDIIIKADVQGSVEALKTSLLKLSNDEIQVKCIHNGVGAITESDVSLASASNAVIIGFNVKPDAVAKAMAEREGVDIHTYNVIYTAIDEVEAAIKGMEAPVYEENIIGHAEIRQLFKASQVGNIAGSAVTDGVIRRGCKCRITRDGKQLFEGDLKSLKRFKDDVKEVKDGFECGLVFDGFDEINVGDMVEAYEMVKVTGDRAAEIKAQRRAEAAEKARASKEAADKQ